MDITKSTRITFPGGALSGSSRILLIQPLISFPNHIAVISEETPFHPLDFNWPDQPGDKGWITVNDEKYPVIGSLTSSLNPQSDEFLVDREIKSRKIKRNDSDWLFLVAHIIESKPSERKDWIQSQAFLEVDADYRHKLSKAHTASHLAALALNKATSKFWKKVPENLDTLDNPNLDALAITTSKITEDCSDDQYRCGKSLRKKGFDNLAFFDKENFLQVELNINKQLQEWCTQPNGIKISTEPSVTYINERRDWVCSMLDGKKAIIPCGGTHVSSISPSEKVTVRLQQQGDGEFTIISKLQ